VSRFSLLLIALLLATKLHAQSVGGSGLDASNDAPQAAELLSDSTSNVLRPFGANLFNGGFSNDREDGLNPSYVVQPGDSVSVRIWGATQFNDNLTVDHQGNIFIPSVGPIKIAGTQNRDLNQRVADAVSTVFSDNVRVYTSLDGSQPVAVFVTGFVNNPGRFAGIPSNSALHFIDRAGGINSETGSYRNIQVMRDGEPLAEIDLYRFLLDGQMPQVQYQDGDTIVVGSRGSVISVSGEISNPALFEIQESNFIGEQLLALALPAPSVSYVGVSGLRSGVPYSTYVPLSQFKGMPLHNGDEINFRIDQHDQVIVVEVEGSHMGPSRYAVPRNTRLQELLDYIEVDPELADARSVSLKRKTIAMRQKAALEESLQRLESRYLTASSQTDEESAIRSQEATLIGQFVERARRVEPNGRLVVANEGQVANIILQAGDTITIPSRSDSVLLSGEVLVSQAMLYQKDARARDYISRSGGFTDQAQTDRIILVHANGEVSSGKNPQVRAGDEIIVLPQVPVKNLQLASTIVDILYKIAIAASVAVQL
jgi:protein involved in polysaccharide export with SLBB domain